MTSNWDLLMTTFISRTFLVNIFCAKSYHQYQLSLQLKTRKAKKNRQNEWRHYWYNLWSKQFHDFFRPFFKKKYFSAKIVIYLKSNLFFKIRKKKKSSKRFLPMTSFNFPNFLPEMWTSLIQFFIILWICRHFWRSGIMTIQTILLICVIRSEPTSSIPNACRVSLNSTWDQNDQAEQLDHDHVWSKSQKRLI